MSDQFGLCFSQFPTSQDLPLLQAIHQHYNKVCWFVKGIAVTQLPELIAAIGQPSEIFACSTACEDYQMTHKIQATLAGLGTWVDLLLTQPCLDLSTTYVAPDLIALDADPELEPELFIDQLNFAYVLAAFDLNPTLLLCGPANKILKPDHPCAQRLAAAKLYGINQQLHGHAAETYLAKAFAQPHLWVVKSKQSQQNFSDLKNYKKFVRPINL